MKEKKTYYTPDISEIDLDSGISLIMVTPEPDPPTPPGGQDPLGGASNTSSFKQKESTSSFDDSPFR